MTSPHPTVPRQQLPNLVLLYLSVARADGAGLDAHERMTAVALARQWAPTVGLAEVEAVVDTAQVALRAGRGLDVEALAEELYRDLPPSAALRLLADLGLIARADGHLTRDEAAAIGRARSVLFRAPPEE
jgi:uncharacterized tellurite resistance protein B-like protein